MDDFDNSDERERTAPSTPSPPSHTGDRRHRAFNRTGDRFRNRDRFSRLRRQLPIAELIGQLIHHHGLTDDVRQRCLHIYWPEIIGERVAAKTFPAHLADGVLRVSAINSSWVHELHFLKGQLITSINIWVDVNRVWLGPPPLVLDMRFALATEQRGPLADREYARRLRLYHARRTKPHPAPTPPIASIAERAAIREETNTIADMELRVLVESVRLKWNL